MTKDATKKKSAKESREARSRQTKPVKAGETKDQCSSGRAFQRDNWKVRPFVQIGDLQNQFQVGVTNVELGRSM